MGTSPNILGKFETDFAIINSRNELLLIELEKPIPLFTKSGHPTAKLTHAYGQVLDWLYEYEKHPIAVLEGMKLNPNEVVAVRGVVIAGRESNEERKYFQRHLAQPLYPKIEFLSLEDLPKSLIQLSNDLS